MDNDFNNNDDDNDDGDDSNDDDPLGLLAVQSRCKHWIKEGKTTRINKKKQKETSKHKKKGKTRRWLYTAAAYLIWS